MIASALLLLAACAPPDRPVIAEVFYDAVGDDTGLEFVELFNPGAVAWPLAGARLESGDGSGPGRWTVRWTGLAGDSVPVHGRFVVGGSRMTPAPNAIAALDLQNGPDAVRLVWPDGQSEVVGYGAHEFAEYFCGAPAPDVTSGQSLARVPDAADRGSNALDFVSAAPSPGRANQPGRDLALVPFSLGLAPAQPEPNAPCRLAAAVTNRGASPVAAGESALLGDDVDDAGATAPFGASIDHALAPADTITVSIDLPGLLAGVHRLRVRTRLDGDEAPENDADSLRVRIGEGPLIATEIQFHPAAGEGEWVEVKNRGHDPLDLARFRLSDRRGQPGTPALGQGDLAPESLAVLAQDRAALLARDAGLDPARIWQVSPWSSLNNSNDSAGVADVVQLREEDGTLSQRVAYSAAGVPAGVPIERRADGSWQPSLDPAGTPLRPPRELPPLAGRFEIAPRRLRAGAEDARLAWALPWARARIAIELYDLAGRRVARPLAETAVAARGEWRWRPADLPGGLYLLTLRARAESGGETLVESRPIRIEGRAP